MGFRFVEPRNAQSDVTGATMRKRRFLPSEVRPIGGRDETICSLHREIDRLFDDFHVGFDMPTPFADLRPNDGFVRPQIDMTESKTAVEVTVELPGVSHEDIEVTVTDNILLIKGEKALERTDDQADTHIVERSFGRFRRSVALPCDVAADNVNASFVDGVLKIELPKPPEHTVKSQRIEIKPAA